MPTYNKDTPEVTVNFKYPAINSNSPVLSELRNVANIKFSPDTGELERAKVIIGFAHGLFAHNGNNEPSSIDPIAIIKKARAGKPFRCVEYCLLANALLWAYGISSRIIGLKTSDVETRKYGAGHVVIEFWSNEMQKWVMCDVQAGIILKLKNILLSSLELGENINNQSLNYVTIVNSRFSHDGMFKDLVSYKDWIREYLYFFDTPIETTFANTDRRKQRIIMLVPQEVIPPKSFQGMFIMNVIYTYSALDFYPKLLQ
jgi:hypothetical protein